LGEQEQQEYLRSIQQEIERLMGLTDRVLDFARPPAVKRRPISVCDVVRYALTLAGKQLESSRIKSDVRLPDTLPPVLASRDLLVQVLLNLIINAIEAMPDGGELTVSAQVIKDHIELSFADTGPGLSPDALDKVFEPFYTTKAEGIGLGLPISHSIIKCHGGAIVAGNTPDGAVFTVELPVARPMDSKQKNHG
jgi:signal transduction histidine kinase